MLELIDLFAGMGGLTSGFIKEGYVSTGYDLNPYTEKIFKLNRLGKAYTRDLGKSIVSGNADVVVGGPPCKPWSSLNLNRRCMLNDNYFLVDAYFKNVLNINPKAFMMENVPPVKNSENLLAWIRKMRRHGYSISQGKVIYSNYGAAISRRRFILIGTRDKNNSKAFFNSLERFETDPDTVGNRIRKYSQYTMDQYPDHVWPVLHTINKYKDKYNSGKFGWYKLDYNKPSPSFGNIMKTYLLHPQAGINGYENRVISVREAMSLMGFPDEFRFPEGMGMGMRYQMVADSVSPVFSSIAAQIIKGMLE
jgi:DNA (cytosine-5)-methyltransferase 1